MRRHACDVLVVGGGPGGSTAAALLAGGGFSVVLVERELFPRFHIGESLLPANLLLLDRLGVHDALRATGPIAKYGAQFYDQEFDRGHTFYFRKNATLPNYGYEVKRAEFDTILLDHARGRGADVWQPAVAERPVLEEDGATVTVTRGEERLEVRARFLVDASGRDGFLATTLGRRERVPNLGKVAVFAHHRGAARAPGIDEGNIRVVVFPDGWFWWIPFAGDVTSVGCVLHAKTVRGREGAIEALYDEMIARVPRVAEGLRGATRITPVYRAANFAYVNRPVVGDRFVSVGDAVAFIDPVFSAGVFIAMASAELAAPLIARALRENRFRARRFRPYERRLWYGLRPFFRFIHKYYEPTFMEIFLQPRSTLGMLDAVTGVLAGGGFHRMSWRMWLSLNVFFAIARANYWVRRLQGRPLESRLEW
jgi:flavin-dependent dehydrogenase